MAFRELVFVFAVLAFGPVRTLGRGSLTIKSITKNPVKKNKELLLVDGEPILLTDNTPILLADNAVSYTHLDVYKRQS